MSGRRARSSARARSSTCSGRSAIRRASSATCSASSRANGSSRSPRCSARSARKRPGWCTAPSASAAASTRSRSTGTTYVAELKDGHVRPFQLEPIEFGVDPAAPEALLGGAPEENAKALRGVLDGELGPFRDIVIMNAGAALIVAGKAALTADAATLARESIDSGRALAGARPARRGLQRREPWPTS